MPIKQDVADTFVAHLEKLGGITPGSMPDRRALAALRRSLATWPSAPPECVRVVAPFLSDVATAWREIVHYLIAGLFASHPCTPPAREADRPPSFGRSLRMAASVDDSQGSERRLLAILGCKSEDLPYHLRHAISYLRAREVAVDYRRLMQDLTWWDAGEGSVQRRWGRDFWAGTGQEDAQKAQ